MLRADNAPVWGARPGLVEELRIGTVDGPEAYVFGRVGAVAPGAGGVFFVADTQVPLIRMYAADGTHLRDVGGRGEGPGEYQAIGGIRTFPDGRLAVWDNRIGRISLFSPAGDFVTSHAIYTGYYAADVFQIDRQGRFYVRTVLRDPENPRERLGEAWIRVGPDGSVQDTLRIPSENGPPSFVLSTASGYDRPFTPDLVTAVSPLGYLVLGRNDSYAFGWRAGAAPVRIERSFEPLRVRGAERAEWEAWADYFESRSTDRQPPYPGAPVERIEYSIPDRKPAFSDLRPDSEGRIWVRRYVQAVERPAAARDADDPRPRRVWREPPTWDVIEPGGRFLGTVVLPWNAYLHDARGNTLWVTLRGEFDEAYVARLRIVPEGG